MQWRQVLFKQARSKDAEQTLEPGLYVNLNSLKRAKQLLRCCNLPVQLQWKHPHGRP